MGRISKQVFADYIEFECDRQLFLEIAENDPRWMQPLLQINNYPWYLRIQRQFQLVVQLGKQYISFYLPS